MLVSMYVSYLLFKRQLEVDKYFMHFEKIAKSLKWPEDVWKVLLQSVFVGKALLCTACVTELKVLGG